MSKHNQGLQCHHCATEKDVDVFSVLCTDCFSVAQRGCTKPATWTILPPHRESELYACDEHRIALTGDQENAEPRDPADDCLCYYLPSLETERELAKALKDLLDYCVGLGAEPMVAADVICEAITKALKKSGIA